MIFCAFGAISTAESTVKLLQMTEKQGLTISKTQNQKNKFSFFRQEQAALESISIELT
jgi:hypothetical protein